MLCSFNSRLQSISSKVVVVHRLHYSKSKLQKIFSKLSPLWHISCGFIRIVTTLCSLFKWYSFVLNITLTTSPETASLWHSERPEILEHSFWNLAEEIVHVLCMLQDWDLKYLERGKFSSLKWSCQNWEVFNSNNQGGCMVSGGQNGRREEAEGADTAGEHVGRWRAGNDDGWRTDECWGRGQAVDFWSWSKR